MWGATLQRLKSRLMGPPAPEMVSMDVVRMENVVKSYRTAQNNLEVFGNEHHTSDFSMTQEVSMLDLWEEMYKHEHKRRRELELLDLLISQGRAHYDESPKYSITRAESQSLESLVEATDVLELIYQRIVEKRSVWLHGKEISLILL